MSYALSVCGVVRVRHLPTFVSVEPANYCQLRCPECPVGMRVTSSSRQLLSMETFRRILEQVEMTAHTMQFYFQGEPLLNTSLPEMISMAHRVGLYTIVSTNAQVLTSEMADRLVCSGLNRVIVSIDGFTPSSYNAYRVGGHLPLALQGLRLLREAKDRYHSSICIELQVLRLSTNESEWGWIRRHYRELGATRLAFKTAQLYDYEHGSPLMPTDGRYSRYRKGTDGLYHLHRRKRRSCYRLWSGCVVTVSGQVLPCCYDKVGGYAFGNILEKPLDSIWHGEKAETFRAMVLRRRDDVEICRECYY